MEVEEILKKAWEAVEKSGVPEPLQEAAFKEAVETLRIRDDGGSSAGGGRAGPRRAARKNGKEKASQDVPDEDTFFKRLASESGVDETDLRDALDLTAAGNVQISPPTKRLGESMAEQQRTVITLVAGARSKGLDENPVDTNAVREEAKRKHCYDQPNFSSHLGSLKGFNTGAHRNEIRVKSKWVDEFEEAVSKALGRSADDEK